MSRPEAGVIAAAVQGARSVRVRGWIREECDSAALEAIVRRPAETPVEAFRRGRLAALDELRRLTRHRAVAHVEVPLDLERGHVEPGYREVDDLDAIRRRTRRLTPREREAIAWTLEGFTGREVASRMGVDPSRVTQLLRAARAKLVA